MKKRDAIEVIARGLWRQSDRILLCRNRRQGHLFLPGGHVEFGEQAADTLRRELREELGLDLQVGSPLGLCEANFFQAGAGRKKSRRHHEINVLFEIHVPHETAAATKPLPTDRPPSREQHIEFLWGQPQ